MKQVHEPRLRRGAIMRTARCLALAALISGFAVACSGAKKPVPKVITVTQGDLVRAVASGDQNRVVQLLNGGANINEVVGEGDGRITPLLAAVALADREMVQLLLRNGAALHSTYLGYSAKDFSLFMGNEEIAAAIDKWGQK